MKTKITYILLLTACLATTAPTAWADKPADKPAAPETRDQQLLSAVMDQNRLLTKQIKLLEQIQYNTGKLLQGARTGGYYR